MTFQKTYVISVLLAHTIFARAQENHTYKLSDTLHEVSGMEQLDDTTLLMINDGGNNASIYLTDFQGNIQKEVGLLGTKNVDWEDLAADSTHVYIADIGNNLNQRRDLVIYKVQKSDLWKKENVTPEVIRFNYGEQTAFPPAKEKWRFDAEALAVYGDSLFIFTKDRTKPGDRKSWVYTLPKKAGTYEVKRSAEIFLGKRGFWFDAVTAADVFGNRFYISTYNRMIALEYVNGTFKQVKQTSYDTITQKESLLFISEKHVLVADEKFRFLGGKLYHIFLDHD